VDRETASQQIRASTEPFGHARSRTQITRFGVESGGYLGNPDRRAERLRARLNNAASLATGNRQVGLPYEYADPGGRQ
jgi:hypothetical protein